MRITVTAGDRAVEVRIKGSSPDALRRAERAARRLLKATEGKGKAAPAFGFSVASDTQVAASPYSDECPF